MPKLLLVVLLAPLLVAVVVLVAPFACLYFLFDRLCDCIEEFKPARRRRTSKQKPADRAAQLGKLLELYSKRGNSTNDNRRPAPPVEPAL